VNEFEDVVVTFTGIAEEFTDAESGEAQAQGGEAGDGEQVVVHIGGSAWAGEGPEQREAIIDDVEGFGFVAKVMLTAGREGLGSGF